MKRFVAKLFVFALLLFLCFSVFSGSDFSNLTALEFVLFLFIGGYCIVSILKELKYYNYSLNMMHWVFVFFFFFIAPVVQILFGYNVWRIFQSSSDIERSCLLLICWILFYRLGNIVASRNNRIKNSYDNNEKTPKYITDISSKMLFFFTILSFISTFVIINNVGFFNLFARSSSIISYEGAYSQMTTLIISHCTKVIILFATFISMLKYKNQKKGLIFLIINLAFLLITCFPTAVARNTAGIVYMGLYAIYYSKEEKNGRKNIRYIMLFILAFVVLFPAINTFRNLRFSEVNIVETINEVSTNIGKNYLSGDYDAFSMITNIRDYTKLHGYSYGKQFVGGLLFMIPRNIWPSKPVGSGSLVFTSLNKEFTNISCPLIAEGYINFGIIGVVLLAFLVGYVCRKIDFRYWYILNKEEYKYSYLNLLYPILLPSYFFMLRGDFMSTWSNLFVFIVLFYIFSKMLLLSKK